MTKPLMKCGHSANATNQDGNPVCAICIGIDAGGTVVDEAPPDLTGRIARCVYCKQEKPSSFDLPFFEYGGDKWKDLDTGSPADWYYCGCRGWD